MGLVSRLIGYAVVGALMYSLGSCNTQRRIDEEPTTPQLYTIEGVGIEEVTEPLYCMDQSEFVQYESILKIMVDK